MPTKKTVEELLALAKAANDRLTSEIDRLREENKAVEKENADLAAALESSYQHQDAQAEEIFKLQDEVARLEMALVEAEMSRAEVEEVLSGLNSQMERVNASVQEALDAARGQAGRLALAGKIHLTARLLEPNEGEATTEVDPHLTDLITRVKVR